MEAVILEHYHRYPLMKFEDFLKLIYQNSFGPKHMDSNPNLEKIKAHMIEEFEDFHIYEETHQVENIGNDYYRVSLSVVTSGLMTITELAKAFYQSMLDSPIMDDESINLFTQQLNTVCDLVEREEIVLNQKECSLMVEEYLDHGIRPINHSKDYRENYYPHYRVIHKQYLKNHLDII